MEETSLILQPGVSIKPVVTMEEVENILSKNYGLAPGKIRELNGYDDKNYKVTIENRAENENTSPREDAYVLKIMNSLDSKKTDFVEAQNSIMLFLGKNGVNCPKPVKTKFGSYFTVEQFESGKHVVRLFEFIPGTILCQLPPSDELFYQAGEFVAKLDLVLKKFHHPAYDHHDTLWKMESVPKIKQFLFAVEDGDKKRKIEKIVERFEKRVLAIRDQLEIGMIHGDFNEQNIVVNEVQGKWSITSILDFGDTSRSCYLFELAISMFYMMVHGKCLEASDYVIAGYSSVRPIPDMEFDLLKITIMARMAQSLVMGAYTIRQDPENSYLLVTAASGWSLLDMLWNEPEEKLIRRWKAMANVRIRNGNIDENNVRH